MMNHQKTIVGIVTCLLASSAIVWADAKDDVVAAAQKLSEATNYSWSQNVEGGFGAKQDGKIQGDGLTYVSMTFRDNTMEMYFQGDKGAVKTEDGWQSLASAGQDNGGGFNPVMMASRLAKSLRSPATLAQDLVDKTNDLKKTDDTYSGNLTTEESENLLRFGRRRGGNSATVKDAKGSVSFTITDGMLTKVLYHISGTVNFNGNDRDVNRTVTIDIKDIGQTKIDVPAEAKAKFDEPASTQPASNG
jgi:hypothetical protein